METLVPQHFQPVRVLRARQHFRRALALAALVLAAALYLVTVVYAVGETLLAATMLVIVALAAWTYSSAKTMAW